MAKTAAAVAKALNRLSPAADDAKLGTTLDDVINAYNQLVTEHNALVGKHNAALAKLDGDAGVTDTNYAATQGATASTLALKALGAR